jgi:glycosyltransferase involved in cell wall biosynthesis
MSDAAIDLMLSVVLPVYNNGPVLDELYRRIERVMREALALPFELVFVVDHSPDNSAQILNTMSEADASIRVIELPENVGQNRALIAGLRQARGQWIALMDADLQDPPEGLERLLPAAMDLDCVVFAGSRGSYQDQRRMLTSRFYKVLLSRLTGLPRDAGSMVVLPRSSVDQLLSFDEPHPTVVALIGCTRGAKVSLPVPKLQRPVGESGYNRWGRLRSALRGLRCVARHRFHVPIP